VRDLPGSIASLSGRLSNLMADQATATTHANDLITIGSRPCGREDVAAVLTGQLDSLPRNVRETTRVPLGIYRGLRFGLVLHAEFPPEVYLEGAISRQSGLSREHQGPRAVLNALERLAGGDRPHIPGASNHLQALTVSRVPPRTVLSPDSLTIRSPCRGVHLQSPVIVNAAQ
jgi:hypothetical protein